MAQGYMETSWPFRAIPHPRCYHRPSVIGECLKKIKGDCSDAAVLRKECDLREFEFTSAFFVNC